MRRLLTGTALTLATVLAPMCVRADDAESVVTTYALSPSVSVSLPHFVHARQDPRVPTRTILYVLQAVDAVQTARALRDPRNRERNSTLRPFTRGGVGAIAFGFALGDLVRDRLLRHAPESARESANGLQALANVDGILTTGQALHAP